MRIAQLLSTGLLNGAARHCLVLSTELARRGHQVLLVHRPGLTQRDEAVAAGVTFAEASFKRTPSGLREMWRILEDHGTEVAHTHMSGAHASGAILRLLGGPPTVATAHACHLQLHWFVNDLVIAFNDRGAVYHQRVNRVAKRRLTVIPAFLGVQWLDPPTPERRAEARLRLGLAPDAFVVGQVGDINFDKRQSDLILAAMGLLARRPQAVVLLKGSSYEATEARRVARAVRGIEDRVVRIDRGVGDLRDIFHALDVFVISSRTEQLPTVAVEAMAAALPIVSTRVGRMEDLLRGEEAGFLVKPGDVRAIAAAIERLADDADLRRRMGEAARRRALMEQDPAPSVARIEAALEQAARGRRPAIAA